MSDTTQRPCPACDAAAGEACHVPVPGVETAGWSHDARILLPVYEDLAARAKEVQR